LCCSCCRASTDCSIREEGCGATIRHDSLESFLSERFFSLVFKISLWLGAAFAATEIIGGAAAYFFAREFLIRIAVAIAQGELNEDPRDPVADVLLRSAQHFSLARSASRPVI
jgi:uncharacterized membrane protein